MDAPTALPDLTDGNIDRLKAKLNALPANKKGALIVGVDWVGGVPVWGRVGVATRMGDHFQLAAEADLKKSGTIYAAFTW